MPVKVARRGDKFRVVEADGTIAMGAKGAARDGGGHRSRAKAERQARAINTPAGKGSAVGALLARAGLAKRRKG